MFSKWRQFVPVATATISYRTHYTSVFEEISAFLFGTSIYYSIHYITLPLMRPTVKSKDLFIYLFIYDFLTGVVRRADYSIEWYGA
jgi:hypothetical protein